MNFKQFLVLVLTIAIIGAIFYFTPRYKLVPLTGEGNFARTQQGSPLFDRCAAPARYSWEKIIRKSVPVILVGLILILILKDRKR